MISSWKLSKGENNETICFNQRKVEMTSTKNTLKTHNFDKAGSLSSPGIVMSRCLLYHQFVKASH